jgi:magnesium-transporting ATPase (P-type)
MKGLYEDPTTGWIEGAAILFAVLLVATVTATNDYRKESQFRKLNAKKDDVTIGVIRNSEAININVKELVGYDCDLDVDVDVDVEVDFLLLPIFPISLISLLCWQSVCVCMGVYHRLYNAHL